MEQIQKAYLDFLKGDQQSFELIVKEFREPLILFINSYVKDIYTAEDLTEDTFFKLLVKKPHYNSSGSFKAWIYTIAKNIALDYCRKNSKIVEQQLDEQRVYLQSHYNEKKQWVLEAMKKISPQYSNILYLKYYEDFSNEEIAQILKKNKRQVETMLYRAKAALSEQLQEVRDEN